MSQYPFIDIAVHEKVRERFAHGEAMVIFSPELDRVLWANGAGARLFGNPSIHDFIDRGPLPGDLAFRQMATTAGQLSGASSTRNFLMRVNAGFERVTVQATVERISIGFEPAILFAAPDGTRTADNAAIARKMIDGFDDLETHVAVIGDHGSVIAASDGFRDLGLTQDVIEALTRELKGHASHVLKRPLESGGALHPAAIARISEDPTLSLMFVIKQQVEAAAEPDEQAQEAASQAVSSTEEGSIGQGETPTDNPEVAMPADSANGTGTGFVFNRQARPARFVWRIDAAGVFQEVSGELATAVGPVAADVEGKRFAEVAERFKLDPDGRITELLRKRNTWSGRTVLWPVENTGLKVPVDLAALPTYSRDHDFEGFRGFGIIRLADASDDTDRLGLQLAARPEPAEPVEVKVEPELPETPAAQDQSGNAKPRSEPPALKFTETPMRRYSDKVIRFEDRRTNFAETLSSNEQAAFREIAEKLGTMTGLPATAPHAPSGPTAQEDQPRQPPESEEQQSDSLREDMQALRPFRESGEGLTTIVAMQLPVALLIHTGDRLIYANPEFLRLTGDENLRSLEARGGIDGLLERDEQMNPDGSMMLMIKASGERVPVDAKLQSLRWEGRSALLLALNPLPANEAKTEPLAAEPVEAPFDEAPGSAAAAELAGLRAEVGELRAILETATDGVVIVSNEGDIRSMNRSASALFNYDEAEVRGKPFATLFAHDSQRAVADYLAGLSGHGVASVLNDGREVVGREASGGRVPLFMTLGRLASSASYCAVIRDITQWKRSEDELKAAKRAAETANAHKTDFLAKVSHEIRTPLNAIIGFSDMMANERFGPIGNSRYIEYANDISRSGRYVLDIVNDLLDISKIEAGEMDLDFAAVRLNMAVSEAISLLQPQANAQRVIIRTALSDRVPEIVADKRAIKQIVINILANAIKFTPAGGQIVVSTAYDANGSVALRIRDTGVGMTREELEQAMKPFKQAPSSAARARGEGTGLGLPLTKAMTEANRASFAVSSTPNEGTLVEITFPSQRVLAD